VGTLRDLMPSDLAAQTGGASSLLPAALVDTILIVTDQDGATVGVADLPPDLRGKVQRPGVPPRIELRAGVNVMANVRLNPNLPGLVGDLVSTLGITVPLAPLSGTVPAASLGTLVGPAAARTNATDWT
jgi:hypothetical protein